MPVTPGRLNDPTESGTSRPAGDTDGASALAAEVLAFERRRFRYAAVKERAVRDQFGWTMTRYYQVLGRLIDSREAGLADAVESARLRAVRDA